MLGCSVTQIFGGVVRWAIGCVAALAAWLGLWVGPAAATSFTSTVPGTSIVIPDDYPEAGGVVIVLVGANGNVYYQFSDPKGAFVGFQLRGKPRKFRGNPFTINDPLTLNCGFSDCTTYFGGSIEQMHIRFSAYDGDTQQRGFDEDDIFLRINGYTVGNWSDVLTEKTNDDGTQSFGTEMGFGNNSFNTGWFQSTNPALLSNILTRGQTTTQVFDNDPDDNYWDFSRGPSLSNRNIVTVAPGYDLVKQADRSSFAAVGEVITYTYTITNIGSVPIRSLSLFDDKIANVTCDRTVIEDVNPGATPQAAICTGQYTVTQQDYDAQQVTNVAQALGVPDFGTLGTLTQSLTVPGPGASPSLSVEKTSSQTAFGVAGTQVPYTLRVTNTGDVTLRDLDLSDSLVPGATCAIADLAPGASGTCSVTYTVLQSDVDRYAQGPGNTANWLTNTVTVAAKAPDGSTVTATDALALPSSSATLDLSLEKIALATELGPAGQTVDYTIRLTNTGGISFAIPTVNDSLTGTATCPAGILNPGENITCTASYVVQQSDIDRGSLINTASATVTVGAQSVTAQDDVTLTANRVLSASLDKTVTGAVNQFSTVGQVVQYSYGVTNTGTVTINALSVSDDKIASVSCPAGGLLPGVTATCTASYTITQADLNEGEVVNTAIATISGTGLPNAQSNSAIASIDGVQVIALDLIKTAPNVPPGQFRVGRQVTYDFTLTNSGTVDLTTATTGASVIEVTDDKIGTFTCANLPLLAGQSTTCQAQYRLTGADVSTGAVVNEAVATAGSVSSNTATAQISPNLSPGLSLSKAATVASIDTAAEVITYVFTVTNTGDTQILSSQPVTITDALLDGPADCSAQPAVLNPTESFQCTGMRSGVSQAIFDSGSVVNTATARFDFTSGGQTIPITSVPATATVGVLADPGLSFVKSGPGSFSAVGQVLSYSFTLQNTGDVTLRMVMVNDPRIPTLSCPMTDLAPGQSRSCTGTYTVTQADFDTGTVANTATAQAVPAQGSTLSRTDTSTATRASGAGTFLAQLDKSADRASFATLGENVTYTLAVTNTGTLTIPELTLTDALEPSFQCTLRNLAPGDRNTACTFVHRVTQADLDAGRLRNSATLTSPTAPTRTDSVTLPGPARVAGYSFDKRASGGFTSAGDAVRYTFAVTNTGNVTLTNLAITDPFFGTPFACTLPSLAPGATDVSCQATFTVRQADVDAGQITNAAQITVNVPPGVTNPGGRSDSVTVQGPAQAPGLSVSKTPSTSAFAALNDSITYTFAVTNTGNVTLTDVVVTDADLGFSCPVANLLPGATATTCSSGAPLRATRSFGQADVDAGQYINTVTVQAETAGQGTPVMATGQSIVTGPAQTPAMSLVKSSPDGTGFDTLGQRISYRFTVTNTGNITLTAPITISDPQIDNLICPSNVGLAPGGSLVCTGRYFVTQADLDAGRIDNTASASLTQPVVPSTAGGLSEVVVTTSPSSNTVFAVQAPSLALNKRLEAGQSASFAAIGDTLRFEYVVTNTGNVTLTQPVTVTDDKIAGTLTCTSGPLAPGAIATCAQVWTATQADLNSGVVTNTATAATLFDGAAVTSCVDFR